MPTAKPRVMVTLDEPAMVVLRRLAEVQDRSVSAIVREMVENAVPMLSEVADTLETLKRLSEGARARLGAKAAEEYQNAHEALEPHLTGILDHFRAIASLGDDAGAFGGAVAASQEHPARSGSEDGKAPATLTPPTSQPPYSNTGVHSGRKVIEKGTRAERKALGHG